MPEQDDPLANLTTTWGQKSPGSNGEDAAGNASNVTTASPGDQRAAISDAQGQGGGRPASTTRRRPATPAPESSKPRRAATSYPKDWVSMNIWVPENVAVQARSQMRPQKIGLDHGKGPGQRFNLSMKAIAADRVLGKAFDTRGFILGNEQDAIARTEDAILEAAKRILENRQKS